MFFFQRTAYLRSKHKFVVFPTCCHMSHVPWVQNSNGSLTFWLILIASHMELVGSIIIIIKTIVAFNSVTFSETNFKTADNWGGMLPSVYRTTAKLVTDVKNFRNRCKKVIIVVIVIYRNFWTNRLSQFFVNFRDLSHHDNQVNVTLNLGLYSKKKKSALKGMKLQRVAFDGKEAKSRIFRRKLYILCLGIKEA